MTAPTTRPESVMSPTMLALADTYAQALMEALPEGVSSQDTAEELAAMTAALESVPGATDTLASALASRSERQGLAERAFGGRASEPVDAFVGILARRGRLDLLPAVARRFRRLLNVRQGRVEVTVTTAVALDDSQTASVKAALEHALDAEAVQRTRTDPDLLGGMTVRVGDRLYDASTATLLKQMCRRLRKRAAEQA